MSVENVDTRARAVAKRGPSGGKERNEEGFCNGHSHARIDILDKLPNPLWPKGFSSLILDVLTSSPVDPHAGNCRCGTTA